MLPPWEMMPSVVGDGQGACHILNQPAPSFEDTEARRALVGELLHDGADHGIQARAVTAAGEQTDLHGIHPSSRR